MRHFVLPLLLSLTTFGQDPWAGVRQVLGREGVRSGGAYRVEFARSDLQIQNSSGMLIPVEMGLGSFIAFAGESDKAVASGELCMVAEEIDDVVDDLRAGGIQIDSLGSRMAGESPTVYFLAFHGEGKADAIATVFRKALSEFGKERPIRQGLMRSGSLPVVDWKAVSLVLGAPIDASGASHVARASLGEGSSVRFGGCPCGRTMMFGELSVEGEKLQAQIEGLRRERISVTSIQPVGGKVRVAFEGEGEASRLAASLHDAIHRKLP